MVQANVKPIAVRLSPVRGEGLLDGRFCDLLFYLYDPERWRVLDPQTQVESDQRHHHPEYEGYAPSPRVEGVLRKNRAQEPTNTRSTSKPATMLTCCQLP